MPAHGLQDPIPRALRSATLELASNHLICSVALTGVLALQAGRFWAESADSDDDEDDTAELLRELEKIKRERAEEKERQDREQSATDQATRDAEIATANPLLNLAAALGQTPNGINTTAPGSFTVKRRWDDGA